jgi:hypothetical protein
MQNIRFWVSENASITVLNPLLLESQCKVCITERRDIRSCVHPWHSHLWCLLLSAEWWICPFPDGTWHSNNFGLVSRTQTLNQHGVSRFLQDVIEQTVLSKWHSVVFEEVFSWSLTSPNWNPCDYFLWVYANDWVFQRNRHIILEFKTVSSQKLKPFLQKL